MRLALNLRCWFFMKSLGFRKRKLALQIKPLCVFPSFRVGIIFQETQSRSNGLPVQHGQIADQFSNTFPLPVLRDTRSNKQLSTGNHRVRDQLLNRDRRDCHAEFLRFSFSLDAYAGNYA